MSGSGTVLVTGACGFIGSHLARGLARDGLEVRGLDVRAPAAPDDGPPVRHHRGDLRDRELLRRLLEGVEVVHHLASVHLEVHAGEEEFRSVNVAAVEVLLEEAARAGVRRVVHTSSVGIYGHVAAPPAREDSPTDPRTAYERTKLAGERTALARAAELGTDVVVLRPAWVYGPGCPRTAKLLRAVGRRRFFFVGGGRNLRHPVFVDDVVEAYRRAADAGPEVGGRAFIVAGPRAVPLREMVDAFARVQGVAPPRLSVPAPVFWGVAVAAEAASRTVGREPPFSRRTAAFFQNDNAFDTSAARAALGFTAATDLDEGLALTLAAATGPAPGMLARTA